MAFWRMGNGFSTVSAIDKILDKPNPILTELLDEPDLLQELLAPNTKLVEYLRDNEIMSELVGLVTGRRDSESEQDDGSQSEQQQGSSNQLQQQSEFISSSDEHEQVQVPSSPALKSPDDGDLIIPDSSLENASEADHNDQDNNNNNLLQESDSNDIHEDEEDNESEQHHAQMAAEILSADVWSITEVLMESHDLIDQLWQVLDYPTPLDMSQASYFTKINEHLLDKKTEEMLEFIRNQRGFVRRFMKHIDNPPLMDFLLKVISSDKAENSAGIIDFLQRQKLIPSLIAFVGPDIPSSVQSAAGDFLKAFVTISANSNSDNSTIGPNELSRELVSEPCVRELVRLMLYGGTGLTTAVGVVIEIIRKNNSDYDFFPVQFATIESHPPGPRDPIYLGTLVKIFSENVSKFEQMLTRVHNERLKTPFGEIEPLGFERFKICELIAELLHCSNMALLNDPSGEAIVLARDQERERVKRVIAAARGEETASTMVSELSQLNLHTEGTTTDGIIATASEVPEGNDVEMTSSSPEPSNKDLWEPSATAAGSDPDQDSTIVATSDQLGQDEASLRLNPVVGDRFKIALRDHNIIVSILEMFFNFPWNNFLHNVVFDIVQQILNGSMQDGYNRYLAIDLFGRAGLTRLICEGQTRCAEYEKSHHSRLGYMGHLTLISEEVVKFTAVYSAENISPEVVEAVTDPDWILYVAHSLVRTRDQYNAILGGQRPEDSTERLNPDAILLGNGEEQDEDDDIGSELGEDIDRRTVPEKRDNEDDEEDDDEEDEDGEGSSRTSRLDSSGDQFARYMTQQISGAGHFGSSDEDDDDEWENERGDYRNSVQHALEHESSTGFKIFSGDDVEHEEEADPLEDASNSPKEYGEDDEDLGLVRSKSYNEMNWDEDERERIIHTADYLRDSEN